VSFTPREPRTDEELDFEARQRRYVATLVREALDPDDVVATVALREIAYVLRDEVEADRPRP
jgi:hypothetical protein